MEKEFVTYELALRMKQLGFNETCLGYYAGCILCTGQPREIHLDEDGNYKMSKTESFPITVTPTYSQAFRWFRDNHYAFHEVFIDCEPKMGVPLEEDLMFSFTIHLVKADKLICGLRDTYRTQEEAELACLEKLIEIVEGIES